METYPKAVEVLANDPMRVKLLSVILHQLVRLREPVTPEFVAANPWASLAESFEEPQRLRLEKDLTSVLHQVVRTIMDTRKEDRGYFFEIITSVCGEALLKLLDIPLLLTLSENSVQCAQKFGKEFFRKEPEYLTRLLRACDVGGISTSSTTSATGKNADGGGINPAPIIGASASVLLALAGFDNMSGESGDLDEISRQKRSCVLAISLLRIFLTNSPDMCSGAVFEEGVDILLRGIEETHEGQQWLLRNEQPSLIILQTVELLIREGKEVSRRFLRQQQETADRLVHKCEQLLTVKQADTRVFSSILNIVELFYADHDATSQTNTSCAFGRFDDTRRFCLRFVPMLSKKTGVFRSGDDLLLRSVHLLSKLVAGMPKGGMGTAYNPIEGGGTAVARKDSLGSTYSSDVNMQSEEDNSAFHRGRASSNDSVTVAGINSSTRFAAPTADEKTVFAYVLGGEVLQRVYPNSKNKKQFVLLYSCSHHQNRFGRSCVRVVVPHGV